MGRICFVLLGAVVAVSCGLQEIGERKDDDEVWIGPGFSISEEGEGLFQKTVWYVTGFDYPEGYDWRSDSGDGAVKCSLVVFANAVPMIKVPVGAEYDTSSAPDMHRMAGGNLYTEFTRDSLTIIKRNGRPFLQYPGEEKIVGMMAEDDGIYTLGQATGGKGFSYRRNGEKILYRNDGYLFEHFTKDSTGHCFAFCEPIQSVSGSLERYFICVGGKVSQIAVREDVKKVWDVMFHKGKPCYIASLVGVDRPVLVKEDRIYALEIPPISVMNTCRFIPGSTELYIEGVVSRGGLQSSGIWKEGKCLEIFQDGMTTISICSHEDGIHAVLTTPGGAKDFIYRSGEMSPVPEGYSVIGANTMAMVDGILHVGLSSLMGGRALVWKDGETEELRLDGYIASVTTGQSSQETVRE